MKKKKIVLYDENDKRLVFWMKAPWREVNAWASRMIEFSGYKRNKGSGSDDE